MFDLTKKRTESKFIQWWWFSF